jgi:hypothetical protein
MPISSGAQSTSSVTAQSRNRCGQIALPKAVRVSICARIAAHGPTGAVEPEVTPDAAHLALGRFNQLECGTVQPKPALDVRRQRRRDGGIGSPGLGLRRGELQAVGTAVAKGWNGPRRVSDRTRCGNSIAQRRAT